MFHVGQLVVCVDDEPSRYKGASLEMNGLTAGRVYTVRAVKQWQWTTNTNEGLYLEEIVRPLDPGWNEPEVPFRQSRFRPLDESRLSIFREMLVKPPTKELVDEDLDARIADCERAVREALGF